MNRCPCVRQPGVLLGRRRSGGRTVVIDIVAYAGLVAIAALFALTVVVLP